MNFFDKDNISAFEAKEIAQWIAFGPIVFQAARILRNSGILSTLEENNSVGLSLSEIAEKVKLPIYGTRVLLESGLGMGLVISKNEKYQLSKTGMFILNDELTRINMDFVHDVCYKGLFNLDKSIENGKPEGLKELGAWPTIYEGLSQLPEHIQKSWFSFDHFYSDIAFPHVLAHVFKNGVKKILDIGGNTGNWAIACAQYAPDIQITIMDLPGQLDIASKKIEEAGIGKQVSFVSANILDKGQNFPEGYDAIWMSQFLDCFSEEEIISILKRCHTALSDDGSVFILETFWDRQKFKVASFCLQQTSLYFTAMANGNSQMYHSETFINCIHKAGLQISEQIDNIGLGHTLLKCKKGK